MSGNWSVVEALRHARHDWMNDLQLIKGNLDLNRVDKAKQIIEEMVLKAQNESKLSSLKLPNFIEWMMTYNWGKHSVQLEFEVLHIDSGYHLEEKVLLKWCQTFLNKIEEMVEPYAENRLSLSISVFQKEICFIFDFTGILNNKNELEDWLSKQKDQTSIELEVEDLQKEGFVFQVTLF
jgi:stage 0 sporulation protein B (sporulation initiation phosphotransferase)